MYLLYVKCLNADKIRNSHCREWRSETFYITNKHKCPTVQDQTRLEDLKYSLFELRGICW